MDLVSLTRRHAYPLSSHACAHTKHIHAHSHSLSLSLIHTLPLRHSLTYALTHTLTLVLSLSHTLHSLSSSRPHSLVYTHTLSLHSRTHSHTYTLTHTQATFLPSSFMSLQNTQYAPCVNHYGNTGWIDGFSNGQCDLLGETLLDLKAPRVHLCNPCKFAQAQYLLSTCMSVDGVTECERSKYTSSTSGMMTW
jgi:hypothetical protein